MTKISAVIIFLCIYCFVNTSAQCPPGMRHFRLIIDPDEYFNEESWVITSIESSVIFATGKCNSQFRDTFDYCLPDSVCSVFHIMDSNGDGMVPIGYYAVYLNDSLIHQNIGCNYNFGEYVRFGCGKGSICENPFPVDTGAWVAPPLSNVWYVFVPKDTGVYQISTCNPDNLCKTKIWVYAHCNPTAIFNNLLGAEFFADGGCPDGALATLYLPGGKPFYIRLAYVGPLCATDSLHFSLHYTGPIHGCRDTTACNYNPLATVTDTCIYPGSPDCTRNPDLKVLQNEIINSQVFYQSINTDPCEVLEGCLRGMGSRSLISFTTHIQNVGNADYYIGEPPASIDSLSDQFIFDPCHHHWHYRGYAEYLLYNQLGGLIPVGSKNGFCVEDFICLGGGAHKYNCATMGISPGCDDIYDFHLPCQGIDITDIPPGSYTMIVRVNWNQKPDKLGRLEKNYLNNWAQSCFDLTYDNDNQPKVEFKEDQCPPFVDCSGVPYGSSLVDCNGICKGTAKRGDLNQDTILNTDDVQLYLNDALNGNTTASPCSDLHDDGQINLFDAALLQECNIHSGSPTYWYQRFPCRFPSGFTNVQDVVHLQAGSIDTTAHTFDVQVVNPYNSLIGYEFTVSGLVIDTVYNLVPGFNAPIQFKPSGKIIALAPTETSIPKNTLPANLLRIHYKSRDSVQACIAGISSIVNSKYQQSTALIGAPACALTGLVKTSNPTPALALYIEPNPFEKQTTVFFSNPNRGPVTVTLSDMTGRILRTYPNFRDEYITIERGNLPGGMYLCTIRTNEGTAVGKLVVR